MLRWFSNGKVDGEGVTSKSNPLVALPRVCIAATFSFQWKRLAYVVYDSSLHPQKLHYGRTLHVNLWQ